MADKNLGTNGFKGRAGLQNHQDQENGADPARVDKIYKNVGDWTSNDVKDWWWTSDHRQYDGQDSVISEATGGAGGDGGAGGRGGSAFGSTDSGNGGAGGAGGDGGFAVADFSALLAAGAGNFKLTALAYATGGGGGDGGHGGAGGFAVNSVNSANGGDGGHGGDGGEALAIIEHSRLESYSGNDALNLYSTARGGGGGTGGAAGSGGVAISSVNSGLGGDGGNGGDGAFAWAGIQDTSVDSGAGDDIINMFATALGGAQGRGGFYGFGQRAGTAGDGGDGGGAAAVIENVDVRAGEGNDRVHISLAAKIGPSGHSSWSRGSTGPASLSFDNNHIDVGDGNDIVKIAGRTDFSNSSNKLFNNSFDGGSGSDTLDFHLWAQALKLDFSIAGGPNLDLGKGLTNSVTAFESFVGTAFGDRFTFSSDSNVKVSGGGGADWFSFEGTQPTGSVLLSDFKSGKDKLAIDVSGSGTPAHLLQVNDVHDAKSGGFPTCIYDTSGKDSGSLYFDPTGGSSDDAFLLAVLSNKAALATSDILFV